MVFDYISNYEYKQYLKVNKPYKGSDRLFWKFSFHLFEVIQPQVPLRLPCYDFTPVANPTVVGCLAYALAHQLKVESTPMA